MSTQEHDDVVRRSFERQVGLFTQPDSPFATRTADLAWLEPLDPDMIVLDVACGAAQLDEEVAAHVRQVVGVDLTDVLLALGAERLRDHGVGNVLLQSANATRCRSSTGRSTSCAAAPRCIISPIPRRASRRWCGCVVRAAASALSDLVAPSADVRDEFDRVHQLIDPSHRRAFVPDELAALFPDRLADATPITPMGRRLPLDIAMTDQSDRDAVVAALRAELSGGPPTGFDPEEDAESGSFTVMFPTCAVAAVLR